MLKREEIYDIFPSQYNLKEDSNNKFILDTFLDQIEEVKGTIESVYTLQDLDKSRGVYLDRIGNTFGIKREINEIDEVYKGRIKLTMYENKGTATLPVLYESLKTVLGNENEIILFREGVVLTTEGDIEESIYEFISFKGQFSKQYLKKNQVNKFKTQNGTILIILTNKVPKEKKERLINVLNRIKAVGIKIYFEFKYKVYMTNCTFGMTLMGVHTPQPLLCYLFDDLVIENEN